MRIYFDTNVLFSAFGFRGLCQELFRECIEHHTIVISEYVIEELERTMLAKLDFSASETAEISEQLRENCEITSPSHLLDVAIRDKIDPPILSAAVLSKCAVLVTGDKDLLELLKPTIEIMTPRQFSDQLFA